MARRFGYHHSMETELPESRPPIDIPASHTPGRGHRRKSDPPKKERYRKTVKRKKEDEEKRYEAAVDYWRRMSEFKRRLRPECDPEKFRPRWILPMTMPPVTKHRFGTTWVELEYLCEKMQYWLYERKDKAHACRRYVSRLEQLLATISQLPHFKQAIIWWEASALLHEVSGQMDDAIRSRRKEIELMQKLHEEANKHQAGLKAYILQGRGKAALKRREAILQRLINQR